MWKRNLFALGGLAIVWFNTAITISVFSDVFGRGLIFAVIPPISAGLAATAVVVAERYKLVPRDDETPRKARREEDYARRMHESLSVMEDDTRTAVRSTREAELVESEARLRDAENEETGVIGEPDKKKRTM